MLPQSSGPSLHILRVNQEICNTFYAKLLQREHSAEQHQ